VNSGQAEKKTASGRLQGGAKISLPTHQLATDDGIEQPIRGAIDLKTPGEMTAMRMRVLFNQVGEEYKEKRRA
jgi:hypothetical protein